MENSKGRDNQKANDLTIKGLCEIGFMGRDLELLFDPNIDLTKIPNSTYKTNTWLNPLK